MADIWTPPLASRPPINENLRTRAKASVVARGAVLMLLVFPLLSGMIVAWPQAASADDVISEEFDLDGEVEEIPAAVGDDEAEDVREPGDTISLEDLLSAEEPLVDDILRPEVLSPEGSSVSVGTSVQGWPAGNLYTNPGLDPYTLEVYVPNEEYYDIPWHELTTRLPGQEGSPQVSVPHLLRINRSADTGSERVTNAFYSDIFNSIDHLDDFDRPLDTLGDGLNVQGMEEAQYLSTNITFNDLERAGKFPVRDGYFFMLNVIPSSADGSIDVTDKGQGRYFNIHFVPTHDPLNPPPSVVLHPGDITVEEGVKAEFSASASSATSRQWQTSTDDGEMWENVSGATGLTMTTDPVDLTMDGQLYRVVFRNGSGSVTSDPARLTVLPNPYPVVTRHPQTKAVGAPRGVDFRAGADSVTPMSTRWQRAENMEAADRGDWEDIPGEKGGIFSIDVTAIELNGTVYRAIFSNDRGEIATDPAVLYVWSAPGARLEVSPRAVYVTSLGSAG